MFIVLGLGSIFFQFMFLGWGASTDSTDFNLDFALICQILVLALLSIRKFENRINDYRFYRSFVRLFCIEILIGNYITITPHNNSNCCTTSK